jgi:RNA polymerase sigma-70 factor, ECF subfamily
VPATPGHYAEAPEALVISLAARGDRVAFTDLVRRRQPWLRNLMRRLSGDSTLADDLAQSVFLKTWRRIRQLKDPERFGGWLKQVAVREWIDHQRKHGGRWDTAYDDEFQAAPAASASTAMDLDAALATLPEPVRLCIVLSYHEGLSHPEIAKLAGLPDGTVKSHIRRGSQKLRELLSAYGEAT